MKPTKISSILSFGLLLGTSTAFAADNIYTAPSFFDEVTGAYFGPDCDQTNYSGAYYTGDYTSPFKTYLGKTDEEIQAKMDEMWDHYFGNDENAKVFYDTGNEGYIKDINNNDVRSEGMSYGMMIAVQTNHKEQFDKLWNWAKNHMWHKGGEWDGYFAWQRGDNGQGGDDNCAPDGEMYFMMSLLFAANRWNDTKYMDDAQYILDKMWSNNSHKLFNQNTYIITFQPTSGNSDFSDPSYDLPAFIELFARWSTKQQDNWKKALTATRDHLYKSSNQQSGLFTDYNNFDGSPKSVNFNSNSHKYMYDAMRCAMNFGMDYYLFGADATREEEMAKRIIDFFEKDGYKHARFDWDGSNPGESYTQGEAGANAVAAMALVNASGYEDKIKKNLQNAWDTGLMTGQYRYYDGLVHYLAMLRLSGNFKIWKPKPEMEKKTVEGNEYNGVTYDKETTINAFEGCKLYEVTIKANAAAPTPGTTTPTDTNTTSTDTTATSSDTSAVIPTNPTEPGSVDTTSTALTKSVVFNSTRVWSTYSSIVIENAPVGTKFIVTDMNGRVMMKSKTNTISHEIQMSNKGAFLVLVGNKAFKISK